MTQLAELQPTDFESEDAYLEFVAHVMSLPSDEQRLRYCSVIGRPSQFVGPVHSLAAAIEHWKQWEDWDRAEQLRKKQVRQFLAAGDDAQAPLPPVPTPPNELDELNTKWRSAIQWSRENKLQWDEWRKQAVENIRQQYEAAEAQRDAFVKEARDAYRAARNKT